MVRRDPRVRVFEQPPRRSRFLETERTRTWRGLVVACSANCVAFLACRKTSGRAAIACCALASAGTTFAACSSAGSAFVAVATLTGGTFTAAGAFCRAAALRRSRSCSAVVISNPIKHCGEGTNPLGVFRNDNRRLEGAAGVECFDLDPKAGAAPLR